MLLVRLCRPLLLPHLTVWNIKSDFGLVAAALIAAGGRTGRPRGRLGDRWVLNLFSAGELWLNLFTNGGAGLFAGLLARQVAENHSALLAVGVLFLSLRRWVRRPY